METIHHGHVQAGASQHPLDHLMGGSDLQNGPIKGLLAQPAARKHLSETVMTGDDRQGSSAWPFSTASEEERSTIADAQHKAAQYCSRRRACDVMLDGCDPQDALVWQPKDSWQSKNAVQGADGADAARASMPQHTALHGTGHSGSQFRSSEAGSLNLEQVAAGVDEATNVFGHESKERYLAIASQTIKAAQFRCSCLMRSTSSTLPPDSGREGNAAESDQDETRHAHHKHMPSANITRHCRKHKSASLISTSEPDEAIPRSAWGGTGREAQQQSSARDVLPAELKEMKEAGRLLLMLSSSSSAADGLQQGPGLTQGGKSQTPGQSRGLKRHGLADKGEQGASHDCRLFSADAICTALSHVLQHMPFALALLLT